MNYIGPLFVDDDEDEDPAEPFWQVMELLKATQGVPPPHTDCDCDRFHPTGPDIGWPKCMLYITCNGPYLVPVNPPDWIGWEREMEDCLTKLMSSSAPAPHFIISRQASVSPSNSTE